MLLPLTLVAVSAACSLAYRYSPGRHRPLSTTHSSALTIAHAFAIEALQLSLTIIGATISGAMLCLSPTILYHFRLADFDLYISTWLAAAGNLALYALAVFGIDAIDGLVQLGSWSHPVQMQTLLLTRSVLLPGTVVRRRCGGCCSGSEVLMGGDIESAASRRGRSRTCKALTASSSSKLSGSG
jgi:hypothetical protein